jgi:hypothetical protein
MFVFSFQITASHFSQVDTQTFAEHRSTLGKPETGFAVSSIEKSGSAKRSNSKLNESGPFKHPNAEFKRPAVCHQPVNQSSLFKLFSAEASKATNVANLSFAKFEW